MSRKKEQKKAELAQKLACFFLCVLKVCVALFVSVVYIVVCADGQRGRNKILPVLLLFLALFSTQSQTSTAGQSSGNVHMCVCLQYVCKCTVSMDRVMFCYAPTGNWLVWARRVMRG